MEKSGRAWSDPISFRAYVEENDLEAQSTAAQISVQSLEGLDGALRHAGVMVFRLGKGRYDSTTQFALARAPNGIEEFFLKDIDLFEEPSLAFEPRLLHDEILPFRLFGELTEGGALNLAIAAGLLAHALGLDEPHPRFAPAAGCSTYTFDVAPHVSYHTALWQHCGGQVDIDAIVYGRRNGKPHLFTIEAKHGKRGSLAKTKLYYAAAAMETCNIPSDLPIIPVYLRSWGDKGHRYQYGIAECGDFRTMQSPRAVASVDVLRKSVYSVDIRG
jgi:hypothetical protein